MAASAASALATAGQAKKKSKKNEDMQHRLRSSTHLHEFVENDRSHVTHFWESVRSSVRASKARGAIFFQNSTKISDLEAADSKTNREVETHISNVSNLSFNYYALFDAFFQGN